MLSASVPLKSSGWGCCLDCMTVRPSSLWELSDGCVYIVRELALTHPRQAGDYVHNLWTLLGVSSFEECEKLHATIYQQVIFSLVFVLCFFWAYSISHCQKSIIGAFPFQLPVKQSPVKYEHDLTTSIMTTIATFVLFLLLPLLGIILNNYTFHSYCCMIWFKQIIVDGLITLRYLVASCQKYYCGWEVSALLISIWRRLLKYGIYCTLK